METIAVARMLGVDKPEEMSETVLNSVVTFKIQKLIIYASLTREDLCSLHNLIPREKAALIHI